MILNRYEDVFWHVVNTSGGSGLTVVMAGHFSLIPHGETGNLIPAIAADIEHKKTRKLVETNPLLGQFPEKTWYLGVEIVQKLHQRGLEAKLLILVNDWQHVPAATTGTQNVQRDQFFKHAVLPPTFVDVLHRADLDESVLLMGKRNRKSCVFWSESQLRARYHRRLKPRVRVESPCAQEWIPLLVHLEEMQCKRFFAFVPGVCRMPLLGGTELAGRELDLQLATTMISPIGDKDNFWGNTLIEGAD